MKLVAFDTETALIEPGLLAPPMTCLTWTDGKTEGILDHVAGVNWFLEQYDDPNVVFVGHNVAFDMAVLVMEAFSRDEELGWRVLNAVFDLYRTERVRDTRLEAQLWCIERGAFRKDFTLAGLTKAHFGIELDKDTHRLHYGELRGVPFGEWPEGAVDYALTDAIATYELCVDDEMGLHPNGAFQAKAAWALHLMSAWGVATDPEAVETLQTHLTAELDTLREELLAEGLLKVGGPKKKPKVMRDMTSIRERVKKAMGPATPLTDKGAVSTDKDTLKATEDEKLIAVSEYIHTEKLLSTYVSAMQPVVNPRFNPLVDTGRTSCRNPNLQNLPRAPGVRECFVPRPGHWFTSVDYDTLELRTLGQTCLWLFGESKLADALNTGMDPHTLVGAQLIGETYEGLLQRLEDENDKEAALARQVAKIANFGYPGGLGAQSFRSYAAGYGVEIGEEQAITIREAWRTAWPEMQHYFNYIGDLTSQGPFGGDVALPSSGRVRGKIGFTEGCNYMFQGLAADGAKEALFAAAEAAYNKPHSPFYGSRPVVFIHDEIIAEVPIERAHEAAMALADIMCEAMQRHVPDIKITAEPALMERWLKGAKPTYDESGRLVPWRKETK